jgi:hypothetical protein
MFALIILRMGILLMLDFVLEIRCLVSKCSDGKSRDALSQRLTLDPLCSI